MIKRLFRPSVIASLLILLVAASITVLGRVVAQAPNAPGTQYVTVIVCDPYCRPVYAPVSGVVVTATPFNTPTPEILNTPTQLPTVTKTPTKAPTVTNTPLPTPLPISTFSPTCPNGYPCALPMGLLYGVIRDVNIRSDHNTNSSILGVRHAGDQVFIKCVYIIAPAGEQWGSTVDCGAPNAVWTAIFWNNTWYMGTQP